jgi:adenosylmethionine-8-amino-7-oxononanoate aminotransferase
MPGPGSAIDAAKVQQQVRDHMMLNFTDMNDFKDAEIPVFVRGEGCHVIDVHGRRFIDGLSGLFCSNLGHSFGAEIGDVAKAQLEELAFTPTWYVAHPRAAELGERIAGLTPSGLNRVFFTTGGGEANESMWKMVRNWHQANGQPQRVKAIARKTAYHGTSLGALSFTGIDFCREPFEPLPIDVTHVSETNAYRHPKGDDEASFTQALLEEMEQAIVDAGPDEVALIIAEPVQNSGGCFVPPAGYWAGLRALADKYGILLTADEVITGFGRVGEWFGSLRYDIAPDFIIFAKGATAGMAPLGGVIVHDRVAEPFITGHGFFNHGITYSGHPVSAAIAHKVIDIYERENVLDNVRTNEIYLGERLNELRRVPMVGDVRGVGHFFALELVKDRDTKESFSSAEADWLLAQVLSPRMFENGLLCRLDDRGEPVIQLSPPLVADQQLLGQIVDIVGDALEHAWSQVEAGGLARLTA